MKNLVVLDSEVYPNYILFAFKNIDNKKVFFIEIKGKDSSLSENSIKKLKQILVKRTTFGFNSRNYDMPIILFALQGKTAEEICNLSNYIIQNNSPSWVTLKNFNLSYPDSIKHFDIQEPSPGVRVSLKLYGGRMHSEKLQDLPIEPNSTLSESEMEGIKKYCVNDLETTIDLYRKIEDRISLRVDMSKRYGMDLLSKSDAQIAETVIKSELTKKRIPCKVPEIPTGKTFKYNVPDFIKFKTKDLKDILDIIQEHDFELDGRGSIKLPSMLKNKKLKLGRSCYQLGIGGIHSKENKQFIIPNKNQFLLDKDVTSYYPSIILNQKLYPKHLGPSFLNVYKKIVEERIKAKKEHDNILNESLKIVINGSYGKLGSRYSILYSPDLMVAVTLTGQLSLLMLIEELEINDISVVSSNTDGFVSLLSKNQYDTYDSICFDWELITGFALEETKYKALYSRDVNNYLAVTERGYKGKGLFNLGSLSKNPQATISTKAVIKFLIDNTPITETIFNCRDLKEFLVVRSVTGGGIYKGEYLGRVVRWIYSTNGDVITYKKANKSGTFPKVPKSDGSRPVMDLTCEFPKDIDYDRYVRESNSILYDLGLYNDLKFTKSKINC